MKKAFLMGVGPGPDIAPQQAKNSDPSDAPEHVSCQVEEKRRGATP